MLEWLSVVFIIIIFVLIFIAVHYSRLRSYENAQIVKLTPFFNNNEKKEKPSRFILCEYAYDHKKKKHVAKCLIPIKSLFHRKGHVQLNWDAKANLPVLSYKQLHVAGYEAIEHYLYQFKESVKIPYNPTSLQPHTASKLQVEHLLEKRS